MNKEEKLNRKIRLKTFPVEFNSNEFRYVYYVLDSPNLLKRIFAPKGILRRAYKFVAGKTDYFRAEDYKELLGVLETYADVYAWQEEQNKICKLNLLSEKEEWEID